MVEDIDPHIIGITEYWYYKIGIHAYAEANKFYDGGELSDERNTVSSCLTLNN